MKNIYLFLEHSTTSNYMNWFPFMNWSLFFGVFLFVTIILIFLPYLFNFKYLFFYGVALILVNLEFLFNILLSIFYMMFCMGSLWGWFFYMFFYLILVHIKYNYITDFAWIDNFTSVSNFSSSSSQIYNSKGNYLNYLTHPEYFESLEIFIYLKNLTGGDLFMNMLRTGKLQLGCYGSLSNFNPALIIQADLPNLRMSELVEFKKVCLNLLIVSSLSGRDVEINYFYFYNVLEPLGTISIWQLIKKFGFYVKLVGYDSKISDLQICSKNLESLLYDGLPYDGSLVVLFNMSIKKMEF